MRRTGPIIVAGGGLAGTATALALRDQGFDGRLVLVDADTNPTFTTPSERPAQPPGATAFIDPTLHTAAFHLSGTVELRLGCAITALAPATRRLLLDDGTALTYGFLVLATGATPRRLGVAGDDAVGVHHLGCIERAGHLLSGIRDGAAVVVIGQDWTALEVAAAARLLGAGVTLVVCDAPPLSTVLGEEFADPLLGLHRAHGVEVITGRAVARVLTSDGEARGIELADGTVVAADCVAVSLGTVPATRLAELAGLRVADGVVTDSEMRTSDPGVWAVGDITRYRHPDLGVSIRAAGRAELLAQPLTAAASILGQRRGFTELPHVRIDQYGRTFEHIGHLPRAARVVTLGDVTTGPMVSLRLDREERIRAATISDADGVAEVVSDWIRRGDSIHAVSLEEVARPAGPAPA